MKKPEKSYLFDTSALLSFIEDEAGADRVEQILRKKSVFIPWMVLLEMYYMTVQEEGQAEADNRFALIRQMKIEVLWDVNEAVVLTAAKLKAAHRISLADAIIAAYAVRNEAILLHKDPEYEALAETVAMEALPYKSIPDKK